MKQLVAFSCFTLALVQGLQAQSPAEPVWKQDWAGAQWIGQASADAPNTMYRFRKQFVLNQVPAKALASLAVDSKYWLWVNDQLVVFEGQLKRGPTPQDSYYDEVDLKPYLRTGQNTLAIMVWYWGKHGFCHNNSGRSGLLFQMQVGNQQVVSNASWQMQPYLAYQNSLPPYPNFRLPEHNIRFDARLADEDWMLAKSFPQNWPSAKVLAPAGAQPWNRLARRPVPLWKDNGLRNFDSLVSKGNGRWIGYLPNNLTITPQLEIEAAPGLLVDIRTDNYYGGSEPNVRTEYLTRQGLQQWETPAVMNGHQVIFQLPEGAVLKGARYRETRYATDLVGKFHSSDPFLNRLWKKAANTLNVNMRDAIQDPDRERAQWWGDVVIMLEEMFYSSDQRSHLSVAKAISNLLEWQRPDSVLFSPVPAGNWDKELPAQMLASVGTYGIGMYQLHSGDTALTRYAYPFLQRYMALWKQQPSGLVQHRAGGWDWHDWGNKIDVPLLDNAWYILALQQMKNMALQLGLSADAAAYETQETRLQQAFQQFWRGNHFASAGYPFGADDRGNGLAVCAGLARPDQWKAMRPMLDTTFYAGPYLEKYILEAYLRMGDAEAGLARMKKRYAAMVNHPAIATLWEGWEIGSATYGGGTYNHGWTGGPLSLLSGYVGGLRPTKAGYETYVWAPQPAGLDSFFVRAQTVRGTTSLRYQKRGNGFSLELTTLPSGGLLILPGKTVFRNLTINGRKGLPEGWRWAVKGRSLLINQAGQFRLETQP